ncbi:MAG: hypothetical protein SFX73_24005 [Kofleriaceae bacterium]|nr:hypothetical protein [Kofleriaceae bacterium]
MRAIVLAVLVARVAHAERPWHGSIGGGSTLVLTGAKDDRLRFDVTLDVKPRTRFGGLLGWRAFDGNRRGMVVAGIVYEGAAARPRLVLDLHAEGGVDLDAKAPVLGAGIRPTLTIVGPLGVVFDTGGYLVLDGIDDLRFQLQASALVVVRW